MKKKKIKFGIVFLVVVILIIGCFSNIQYAKAVGVSELIGVSNLNGTEENSAVVGDILKLPEKGWKRYDDRNESIKYTNFRRGNLSDAYNSSYAEMLANNESASVTFKFYGTKFRVMGFISLLYSTNIQVKIDGDIVDSYSPYGATRRYPVLLYEKANLGLKNHTVTLQIIDIKESGYSIDAIDIDEAGYLIDEPIVNSNEISLNKTSLNLNIGQTDDLLATVKPDNADNKSVTWSSSDESIATVEENGKVTAIKEGSVTITAKTADGTNLTATCAVNVITNNEIVTVESEKDKLALNSEFTTDIVLHNVKNIYAEDFTVAYDKDVFEYIGYEDVEGLKVFKEIKDTDNGKLRFIVASLGEENGINEDKAVVKLKFKTKASGKGKIDVLKTRISDNEALEKDILEENCGEKEFEIFADVNRTGDFTLIDLGIDAYYYGKNVDDTDKTKYDADVISNGVIDDADLAEIAEQMIKNDKYELNN
ncbi:Ig-like domain-containing protein [Clostridium sp. UBA1652]|uniref:Ig-like domain-containing protein n=1 Tax=Clostridium sp. UBA1652 TaxID=1946348 RepID=UPI00257F7751|nr:Ig-like domain-containing protein [Clostridium sp. UBA1652]